MLAGDDFEGKGIRRLRRVRMESRRRDEVDARALREVDAQNVSSRGHTGQLVSAILIGARRGRHAKQVLSNQRGGRRLYDRVNDRPSIGAGNRPANARVVSQREVFRLTGSGAPQLEFRTTQE